jgi:hypothetical protein
MVQHLLEENQTIWESVPQFVNAVQLYNEKLERITISSEKQRSYTVGVLPKRNKYKSETLLMALQITATIRALAWDLQDLELYLKMKISKSALFTSANLDVLLKLDSIILVAGEYATQLSEYGVTPEIIEELQTRRDEMTVGIFAPGFAILKRKDIGAIMSNHFKETEDLLKDKIDGLMEMFSTSQADFYNSFKNARKVVHVVFHNNEGELESGEATDGEF